MERRHQVFVSSTYGDLKDERAEIIQALLELDCIPAGMELFPATTATAWDLIKTVIDDSDYYCLVIGGRYGSVDEDGLSYTEKEYDYAVAQKKPIIAFVHAEPDKISAGKTEKSDKGRAALERFKKKVDSAHHRKSWTTATELGGLVSRSLVNIRKAYPAEGWVRGRYAATDALLVEVANLRARVAELSEKEARADAAASVAPDIGHLASGNDTYQVVLNLKEINKNESIAQVVPVTWNRMLKYVGPALLNECSDEEFLEKLQLCFYHSAESHAKIKFDYSSIVIPYVVRDQIKMQLRALGLMVAGTKRRAVADKKSYWKLTAYGEAQLIKASALVKPNPTSANPLENVLKGLATVPPKPGATDS